MSADPYNAWRHDPDRYEADLPLCPDCGAVVRPVNGAWVCYEPHGDDLPPNWGRVYSHTEVGLLSPDDMDDNGPRDERRAVRDAAMGRQLANQLTSAAAGAPIAPLPAANLARPEPFGKGVPSA